MPKGEQVDLVLPESKDMMEEREEDRFIIDPESFGGTDYPPIVTPEQQEALDNLYAHNPGLIQKPIKQIALENSRSKVGHHFMSPISPDPYRPDEPWIQTYSGRRFNPTNPNPEGIVIQDIAHSLSMQCRFSGHSKKFYSVGQHSVLVSHICNQEDALWGLMHDASEAYLVDIPRPLKRSGKFEAYRDMENVMMKAICKRFGLPEKEPPSVKIADTILLATEARDLMIPLRSDWVQPVEPLPFKIESWSPQEAKNQFMKRFFQLIGADSYHYEHYLERESNA